MFAAWAVPASKTTLCRLDEVNLRLAQRNQGKQCMAKWRSSDNFRIIWVFPTCAPTCSEGNHILSFFEETSLRSASRTVLLALIFVFCLCSLPTVARAAAQAGQIIETIDVQGNRRIPTETVKSR